MHKKARTDTQRAKAFTKLGREISVCVRQGGGDPETNTRLRDLIAKARANNLPMENVERAIKKAMGEGSTEEYEAVVYEGYGPNGVAVIVEALTDNRNRTASDMRHYFDKYGGNLGTSGSVAWMFAAKGLIVLDAAGVDVDTALLDALEAGADDVEEDGDTLTVVTPPKELSIVRDALIEMGYAVAETEVVRIADATVAIAEAEQQKKMEKLLELLDEHDDVQQVYHNWEA